MTQIKGTQLTEAATRVHHYSQTHTHTDSHYKKGWRDLEGSALTSLLFRRTLGARRLCEITQKKSFRTCRIEPLEEKVLVSARSVGWQR